MFMFRMKNLSCREYVSSKGCIYLRVYFGITAQKHNIATFTHGDEYEVQNCLLGSTAV
jgi:hypothetical protein